MMNEKNECRVMNEKKKKKKTNIDTNLTSMESKNKLKKSKVAAEISKVVYVFTKNLLTLMRTSQA